MKTLYLGVVVSDADFDRMTDELYVSDSALTRRLEMVLSAKAEGVVVEPVRNAVMLKIGDAMTVRDALKIAAEAGEAAADSDLEGALDMAELHQAFSAVNGCLEVIHRHGG